MSVRVDVPTLLFDERRDGAKTLRRFLRQFGFGEIDQEAELPAALDRLRQHRYGLVIAEAYPGSALAFDLLAAVRAEQELKLLPFVIASPVAEARQIHAAKDAGVNAYLLKPFSLSVLRTTIERALPKPG